MGWRMDGGFKHRKINLALDYESVRCKSKGFGRPIQVHETELVVPEHHMFPLYQAEQSRLEGGTGELPKTALPFEEGASPTPGRVRRTYVTLDRAIRFGKTVGCKGCDRIAEGVKHSEACHQRFRSWLEKEKVEKQKETLKSLEAQQGAGEREFAAIEAEIERNLFESKAEPSVPAGQAPVSCDEKSNDFWEFDKEKGAWCKVHVRPRKRLFVLSMPKTLVPKGSLNGVVGIGYQLIKMIGKLTHTKEFALEVGRVVHGFSHQPSWTKGVQQSKQQLQMQRIKDSFQEALRQLSS